RVRAKGSFPTNETAKLGTSIVSGDLEPLAVEGLRGTSVPAATRGSCSARVASSDCMPLQFHPDYQSVRRRWSRRDWCPCHSPPVWRRPRDTGRTQYHFG